MSVRREITSARVRLTYDDFVQFPDDGMRHELIDGEHYVTPAPNTRHQAISVSLTVLIGGWLDAHPAGHLYHAPFDVILSAFDVVEPDLVYISHERWAEVVTPAHARGAPDIVVEIASPGTRRRDETIKRTLYEESGVAEYWFVDPAATIVRVYRRAGDQFAEPFDLFSERADVLTTPLLPGLELPLARIFR